MEFTKKTEEVKQIKPLHAMTSLELRDVEGETKGLWEKYKHCMVGEKVFAENLPYYKPTHKLLLDTLEAEHHLRRLPDWKKDYRDYIPTVMGFWILRALYKYNEVIHLLDDRLEFRNQKTVEQFAKLRAIKAHNGSMVGVLPKIASQGHLRASGGILDELTDSECPI